MNAHHHGHARRYASCISLLLFAAIFSALSFSCARANAQAKPNDTALANETAPNESSATVYVTDTGTKYHVADCKSLSKSKTAIPLDEAIANGYEPCGICHPPVPAATQGVTSAQNAAPAQAAAPMQHAVAKQFPMTITGKVVAVADGDTITVLVGTEQYKIRLNAIDSPEKKQAYGQQAKERMSLLVFAKTVSVAISGQDRYGRYLGTVTVDGVDVNRAMIRDGYAWHYRQYSKDATLDELEASARKAKLGLWKDDHPIPPWDFRK